MVILLVWLWKIIENDKKSNFWILTTVTLGCILGLFMLAPMKAATTSSSIDSNEVVINHKVKSFYQYDLK